MKELPVVTKQDNEVKALLNVIHKEDEELKLFQFLNGLNEEYSAIRSHILMMSPLPSVDVACGMIQQEESQQEVLGGHKEDQEGFAMYGKKVDGKCNNCGKMGHKQDKC